MLSTAYRINLKELGNAIKSGEYAKLVMEANKKYNILKEAQKQDKQEGTSLREEAAVALQSTIENLIRPYIESDNPNVWSELEIWISWENVGDCCIPNIASLEDAVQYILGELSSIEERRTTDYVYAHDVG